MYFAHAGHEHPEASAQAPNQLLPIIAVVVTILAVTAVLVILDIRRKRAKNTAKLED